MTRKHQMKILILTSVLMLLISMNIAINVTAPPAFAAERVLTCTQAEHTHGDSCYTLVSCSDAERIDCKTGLHYHGASCYDASGKLVCGKANYIIHTHNEYCYNADGQLVCSLAGKCVEAHTHSSACYDSNGKLTCTLPEVKAHTHTKSCYTVKEKIGLTDTVLICTLPEGEAHTHTQLCYEVKAETGLVDMELTCSMLEVKVHEHSADCIDASAPTQKSVLLCTMSEHIHGDDCYELKAISGTDADSADISAADVSSADVLSGSDTIEQSEMSELFDSLLLSNAPALLAEGQNNTTASVGSVTEYTIPGRTGVNFTFTPEFTHGYKLAFSYSSGSDWVYVYDENNKQITSVLSTNSTTVELEGGHTYRIYIYNYYNDPRDFTITPTVADSNHHFADGGCACGLKEADLGGSCGENASWSFKDGVLTITGTGAMTNYSSGSAPWYNIRSSIDKVVISDGITSVGNSAFYGCTALTDIDIPDSVTSIGSSAFYNCQKLDGVVIPDGVSVINSSTFYGCSSLTNIEIPDGVTSIGGSAFYNCTSLTSVDIPDGVTSIGGSAFYNCTSLQSVEIPDSVTSIGNSAFNNCQKLDNVVIPDGVKSIGNNTFSGCSSLTNIEIPDSVTSIGSSAFSSCSSLTNIDIPDSVTSIGSSAFSSCTSLQSIDIPDGVTSIGSSAFYNCRKLDNVVIPDGIKSINSSTFSGCSSLTNIDIPDSVTSIGSSAFGSCTSLQSIDIPDGVTSIGSSAFYNCKKLNNVVIPDGVKSISNEVFRNCTSLTDIDIPDSVTSIGNTAFYSCTLLQSIDIPDSVTSIGSSAFAYCSTLENVDIPDGVKTISSSAFYDDPKINTLYLPESLTNAGSSIIKGSDGAEVYVDSAKLTSISKTAVSNYKYVDKVTIGDKVDNITSSLVDFIEYMPNLSELDFIGENFITIDKDLKVNGINVTLKAGDYFVDADGVLYRLDKESGTATLYYVPGDLTEYTVIDKTAADEDGTVYTVTAVVSNALSAADSLTKLDFAAPETIILLPSGALANCPTLESVNGAATVADAYKTFTNPAAIKAEQVFYNTGLEEDVTVVDGELSIFGNDTDLIPVVKVIAQKNNGENNEEFADTYTYYTGEYAKVTVGISNANAGDYEVVRVYFAFDDDGGELSWPFGSQTFESDKGTEYDIKTVRSDIDNVYYIECPRLAEGDTISAHINTLFPSPNTEGGKLKIWPAVLTESELEKVGNGVVHTDECSEIEWVTKPDDFALTKSVYSRGNGTCITSRNDETFIANLGYTVKLNRTGDTLLGMGKDHITSVEYTDTITLPEGLEWDEDVINAILNGNVRTTTESSTCYIYIIVDGEQREFCYMSVSNYSSAPVTKLSLGLTDDGNVQIKWTVRNNSVDTSELNASSYTIYLNRGTNSNYSVNGYTYYPSYINCVNPQPEQEYTIHNDVDALQHFSYSKDQFDSAEVDKEFVTGKADFLIDKSWYSYGSYWGSKAEYYVRVSNKSPFEFPGLSYVNDPLAAELYITPANIQLMFDEFLKNTDYLKELSIKITTATLCSDTAEAHTPGATVTAADGTKHTLTQANSGVGTLYHGCEDPDPAEYDTDATLILTCTADGKQTLTYGDKVLDASNVLDALEAVGYVVTADVRYEPKWVFVDDYALEPGTNLTFYIRSSFKDSFMLLNDDMPNRRTEDSHRAPYNYASVWYENSTGDLAEKNDSVSRSTFYRDFYIGKSAIINGDSSLTSVVDGDVLDYTLNVNHYGGAAYEILPLTDHMQGAQVVLVPAKGNEHLASKYGLTEREINGESMYAINKVGTYNDVKIGGMIADSITVSAIDGGGFDTVIHWYLTDITTAAKNKYVSYKAMVDTQTTGVTGLTYSISNETWLNDHQSHRLWSPVGTEGEIGGTGVDFDKYIVTEKGDTPDTDVLETYEAFREGEPTLYRLSLTSVGGEVTIAGDDIYDSLPQTFHDAFVWSKDNVSLRYEAAQGSTFSFAGVDNSDATWYIDSTPPAWTGVGEHEDQQYIRWSSDMQLTISGTLYIYVTLELPEGDTWLDNAIKYRETRLENSFYVREEKMTVYHDLISVTEAYLQKGVWDTGVDSWSTSSQRSSPRRTTPDARQYFYNSTDLSAQVVSYYITVYNSGTTRLYLETIQDALPKGVVPWTVRNNSSWGNSSSHTNYYKQWTSGNVNLTDEDGNKLSPVWKNFNTAPSYNAETNVLSIDLSGGNLRYDNYFGKYYLAPNEGVRLIVPCYVNLREYTDDHITNTVAMPYFDYLAAGVEVSDDSAELNNNQNGITGAALNDGDCEIIDTAQANLLGMAGGNSGTQWLASDVTLRRGQIVPGITKWIENLTTPGGSTVAATETAGTDDTVNWAVKLTDTGNDDISVWRFTDIVNPDYGFTGTVKMVYKDLYTSRTMDLFTIERDKDNLDKVIIKYRNSSGSTLPVELERGGDAVTLSKVYLYVGYVGSNYKYIYSDIAVKMYVDEKGNEALAFDILNPNITIPAGGEVTVKLSTKIFGTWANKVYYNNAYLTPLTQIYDDTRVSQGNHLEFGVGLDPSVRNSAQITAAYGYVTSSEKRIREIGNETNCASSKDEKNWIFLDEHADTFRYTNIVNNITGKSLSKFIMIDNLPEVGDHSTFAETEDRYSEFKVELLADPNFEVSINLDGEKTVLTSDQYTIMFSDRTEFAEKDWDGTSDSGWYTSSKASTRSFRLEIYDNTGLVIPDQASIHVEYNGRIIMAADYANDDVTTDPKEGTIAWNSFGYHYSVLGENISLEAAPLKVGVCIQYIPLIRKTLVYPDGSEYIAEEDESFRFILYSGTQLTSLNGKTEQEIANILKNNKRKVTVVDLTVEAGKSKSDTLRLSDQKVMTYDTAIGSWAATDTKWTFVDGESFTVFELDNAADMYDVQSIATSLAGSYTSAYNGQTLTDIIAVNEIKTWTVRINKTDAAEGKALADATFGIYSLVQREQMSDDDYAKLALDRAPDKTLTHGGKKWYLSQVMTTGAGGAAVFSGLIEDNYIVRELQAPGGYRLSDEIYEFSLSDADSTLTIAEDVVNIADYELPKTGTAEAVMMIVIGNLMMLAAGAVLIVGKRLPELKGLWMRVKRNEKR